MTAATPEQRLEALLASQDISGSFNPASARALSAAARIAPLPEPLGYFYSRLDLHRFGQLELFQLDDYVEVNGQRAQFGELSHATFVASDLAEGWFFVDGEGFMECGAGHTFWCERGLLAMDDCVPTAPTLIDLLERAANGETPWKSTPLGDRAVEQLVALLRGSRAVATRPPVDPARFHEAERPIIPLRLGDLLMEANGFLLPQSGREHFGLDAIEPVPESSAGFEQPGALWVGRGPDGYRYASTTGSGWRGLPTDRLLVVAPGQSAETAPVQGRTADVWSLWIQEDERT